MVDLSKLKLGKDATLNLSVGGAEEMAKLGSDVLRAVDTMSANNNNVLKDALAKVAALSESGQTGGDSGRNKIVLYAVLGLLAVVGLIFYWRR